MVAASNASFHLAILSTAATNLSLGSIMLEQYERCINRIQIRYMDQHDESYQRKSRTHS